MSEEVLYPLSVEAYRLPSGKISICVQGFEFAYENLKIVEAPMPILPSNYMLVGERRELVSQTHYNFCQTFDYPTEFHEIYFLMESGWKKVEILPILESLEKVPETLLQTADTKIVGYAPNSTDLNAAFSDAVNTARSKFPGNISLEWDSAGFFAAGRPVGIAATWVSLKVHPQP